MTEYWVSKARYWCKVCNYPSSSLLPPLSLQLWGKSHHQHPDQRLSPPRHADNPSLDHSFANVGWRTQTPLGPSTTMATDTSNRWKTGLVSAPSPFSN